MSAPSMATEVTMPRLSESMEEGTILKWLVDEGGEVKKGEPLVEIETDKSNTTYDAEIDGVLVEVIAKEGESGAVGAAIAKGDGDGGAAAGDGATEGGDDEAGAGGGPTATGEVHQPVKASRVAKRLAEKEGVELASLEGSGPGGGVVKADVEDAASAPTRTAKGSVDVQ